MSMQCPDPNRHGRGSRSGATLLELITAMTVMAILSGVIFMSWHTLARGFSRNQHKAIEIHTVVRARLRMAAAMENVDRVVERSPGHIRYRTAGTDTVREIRWSETTIMDGERVLGEDIKDVRFTLSEPPNARGEQVLQWEVEGKKGLWYAGARRVQVDRTGE